MADSDETARGVVDGAVGSALGVITQAIVGYAGLSAESLGALSVFAGAVPGILRVGFQRRAERRSRLAQHAMMAVAEEYDVDLSELEGNVETTECFLTMFYDMMDAVDDAAAGPLGHIAMTYVKSGQSPDKFFRAFGRTVRELTATELVALELLLRECVSRIREGRAAYSDSEVLRTDFRDPTGRALLAGGVHNGEWSRILEMDNGLRLLTIMKHHGLAVEPTDVSGAIGGNPAQARLWKADVERALTHLEQGRESSKRADAAVKPDSAK